MAYSERKRRYAWVGRVVRAPGVAPEVVAKYEYAKSDQERSLSAIVVFSAFVCTCIQLRFDFMRSVIADPTLASIEISEEFRNTVFQKSADLYVTAPGPRSRT